jgi:hypothetical protein
MSRPHGVEPPRLVRRLLRAWLPEDRFEIVDGDLNELFTARLADRGARYARRRYRRDAVSVLAAALRWHADTQGFSSVEHLADTAGAAIRLSCAPPPSGIRDARRTDAAILRLSDRP